MNELLQELKERLIQIAMIGVKTAPEDFRLKKLQEKLKLLSSKAPVLGKLYELVTKLIEGEELVDTFAQLNNLVDAIIYTQSGSSASGEEEDVEVLAHSDQVKHLTHVQLKEVRNILSGGTTAKWANLRKAYLEGKLMDYRLLDDFLANLEDTYVYVDFDYSVPYEERQPFSMATIITQFGETVVPLLLKRFDNASNAEKGNIVKILVDIGKEKYNAYYRKWSEDEEGETVVINSLKALAYDEENLSFLLGYKTRKKKLQEARAIALAHFTSEAAKAEVRKQCLKDTELFKAVFSEYEFLSENEFLALLLEQAKVINQDDQLEKLSLYKNQNYTFMSFLLRYVENYNQEKVKSILTQMMELETGTPDLCFESKLGIREISMTLLRSNNAQSLLYLAGLKDRYAGYYITTSFVAALKSYASKKVYDEFGGLVFNNYSKVKVNIKVLLEQLASKAMEIKYDEACATCDKMLTCDSSCFKPQHETKQIQLEGNERFMLDISSIEWDKRWINFAKKNDLVTLFTFFAAQCKIGLLTKMELKKEYIELLNKLKTEAGDEALYPNLADKQRKQAEQNIKAILSGLFVAGASDVVVDHIIYFSFYLGMLEQLFFRYLEGKDLSRLEKIKSQAQTLEAYKKNKVLEFLEKAKAIANAKNGKTTGENKGCK